MSVTTIATIHYLGHWMLITMPLSAAVLGLMDGIRPELPRIIEEYWEPFKNAKR